MRLLTDHYVEYWYERQMRVWMKATYDDMDESYGEYGSGRVAESEGAGETLAATS